MKNFIIRLVAALASLAFHGRADAADITAIKLDDGSVALLLTGDVKPGDGAKFRSEASKYHDGYVLLESDGGSLAEALDIGETIRLKGYGTAVVNDSKCNSACALIWLAGSPRALARSGRVGFHAAYTDSSGTAQESGVANAMVGRYLTLLNLPERAIVFATSSPPSHLAWLTASNYEQSGIDVKVIDDIYFDKPAVASAKPVPPPIVTVTAPPPAAKRPDTELWKRLGGWAVYIDHTVANGCFLLAKYPDSTVLRIGVDRTSDDSYYVVFANQNWTSLQVGKKYDVNFQLDNNSPWNAPTSAVKIGGLTALRVNFTDVKFWTEFTESQTLNITRNDAPVARLNIPGSKAAFAELVSCQKYGDAQTRSRDPFAQ